MQADWIRDRISFTAFAQGLAIVFLLYALLFTGTLLFGGRAVDDLAQKLASETILIEREESVPSEAEPVHAELQAADRVPIPDSATTYIQGAPPQPAPTETIEPPHPPPEVQPGQIAGDLPADLVETTPHGPMPQKSATGMTPFDAYKKPFVADGKPAIVLALLDYGLSETDSKTALEMLPSGASVILSPYTRNFDAWRDMAAASGRELWLQIPVEFENYPQDDPGPGALHARENFEAGKTKIIAAMTKTTGYAGVAAYTDSAFMYGQPVLNGLMGEIYRRGLGYFEINPAGQEFIEVAAVDKLAPYGKNQFIFDPEKANIHDWLKALEAEATADGFAVGAFRPYPGTLKAISEWSQSRDFSNRFAFAPVSALALPKDAPHE